MEKKRRECRLLVRREKERNRWEDQDVVGWIILRWIRERELFYAVISCASEPSVYLTHSHTHIFFPPDFPNKI
jgi:hypothetical protein